MKEHPFIYRANLNSGVEFHFDDIEDMRAFIRDNIDGQIVQITANTKPNDSARFTVDIKRLRLHARAVAEENKQITEAKENERPSNGGSGPSSNPGTDGVS